ncbi:hypothetical protein A0H81_04166 [Grifola frondosa]|uniref:Uncharacterized protein n=1 Tax=Grifola frondosa TaxID=5627 RepID=A0A1C7MEI2_GRIFR|nr:hypothetical protein A0H81_04166 [Grifola frondosa]
MSIYTPNPLHDISYTAHNTTHPRNAPSLRCSALSGAPELPSHSMSSLARRSADVTLGTYNAHPLLTRKNTSMVTVTEQHDISYVADDTRIETSESE